MNLKKMFLKIFIILQVISTITFSQVNFNKVGFDLGAIKTLNVSISDQIPRTFYSEFNLGGDLFVKYFNWQINLGYWNDGLKESISIHGPDYSYSSVILGLQIQFLPKLLLTHFPFPIRFNAGISNHFMNASYINGSSIGFDSYDDFKKNLFYFDLGLDIYYKLINNFEIFGRIVDYIQLTEFKEITFKKHRLQLSIGLAYNFKT